MERPQKQFGDAIKELRRNKGMTLDEMSKSLGISLSLLSDIENKRRNPFNEDQIEQFSKRLFLTETEKAELFDLAARYRDSVPEDIKEIIMYASMSEDVRLALRKTKAGKISKEAWEEFVKKNSCGEENADD